MNTLSTKNPTALTAASLSSAPYYLNGHIEACIEEKFPVYVDDSLSQADLERFEQAVEKWSTHAAIEIIRGEAALAQSSIEILLDFSSSRTLLDNPPSGYRGKFGVYLSRETQVTGTLEAMVDEGRAVILSSKRWDEWENKRSYFWKQSFFLPPAWEQSELRTLEETRAQATATHTLIVYNSAEWLQSSKREAIVSAIKKTALCTTLDVAACEHSSLKSALSQAGKIILDVQTPQEIHAWIQLCAYFKIPCISMHKTGSLSPMRKLAYGITTKIHDEAPHSLRETLEPAITFIKEGTTSLDVDFDQMEQASKELRPKRILETLQLWISSPKSIKADGAKFFFYTLPQERAFHINPEGWSENGICDGQVWPEERFKQPQQITEGFLLLKNHAHWVGKEDARGHSVLRACLNAFLFREPNATWQRDFHAIWSQWSSFEEAYYDAVEVVEAFYKHSPRNKNGYTQIAHGILMGISFADEGGKELVSKAQSLIQKDKELGRYTRTTPHEEVLTLAFQGNIEQAEALLAGVYRENKQAFDGYKVLGQWAQAYGSREQALTYYKREKAEGRRSQECAIQHALIRSEVEPLSDASEELESCKLKVFQGEAAFVELVNRYIRTRFASMSLGLSLIDKITHEKANWSYIAQRLENPETREGQSIASLAKGLLYGAPQGNDAFKKHNTHPKHSYYWAIMHAALGNWSETKEKLSQTKAAISPDLPIQVWCAAQGILSDEALRKKHKRSILECIHIMEQSLLRSPQRTASEYGLLAKLYLYAGKKEDALRAIESVSIIGSPGWRSQFSSILTWVGCPEDGLKILKEEAPQEFYHNHDLFLKALSYTLLGDKENTQKALKSLKQQNPHYAREQSAFRQNIHFCEMAIAETIEDTAWKNEAEQRSRDCDPYFENKAKTWNLIKEIQLTPA